jgi:ketosteroid isomerase-like protein
LSNVEFLRGVYDAWGRGDFTDASVFAPDVEFVYSSDFPEPAVFRGHEGVYAAWGAWLREWDEVRVAAEEFVQVGPLVLVDVLVHGRGRGSGAPVAEPGANLWTFRDGRAVRIEVFASRESARAAAGAG